MWSPNNHVLSPFLHWKPTTSSSHKIVEHFWTFDYKLANGRTLTNNTEQGYQVLYLSHTFLLQKLLNSLKDKKFRGHLQLKSHQHQKELKLVQWKMLLGRIRPFICFHHFFVPFEKKKRKNSWLDQDSNPRPLDQKLIVLTITL